MYDDGDFDPEDKPTRCPRCGGSRFDHYRNEAGNVVPECRNCGYRLAGDNDVDEGKMDTLTKKLNEYLDKRLDFTQYAATVALWPDAQLYAALEDIKKTLPNADAMDRERAGSGAASEGGYYRDQAGVIRAEISRRQRNALRGQ